MQLEMLDNPIWCPSNYDEVSDDDEPPAEEGLMCPTILWMIQEKRMLQES